MLSKNVKSLLLIVVLFFLFGKIEAQEVVIPLLNPSFEKSDYPKVTAYHPVSSPYYFKKDALNWEDCGVELFPRESPPNIFTSEEINFGVEQDAADGTKFLCIVVRENGSWESLSQTLIRPMLANQCYAFKLKMSQSPVFKSRIRSNIGDEINFTEPIVLKIWGGNSSCDREELLAISPFVNNKNWMNFVFYLSPKSAHQSITFEAFHGGGSFKFPNGHILMDDLSSLVPVECNEESKVPNDLVWADYDLNLANLKTVEDLKYFIKDSGANLDFIFTSKLNKFSKSTLNEMMKAMEKFPNYKIVFLLSDAPRFVIKKRGKTLEKRMLINGFPESQYEIRRMNREDKKKATPFLIEKEGLYINLEAL